MQPDRSHPDLEEKTPSPPTGSERVAGRLSLRGGDLSLDFANTVSGRGLDGEHDYLEEYADLLAWAEHAGALDAATGARLAQEAEARPEAAHAALLRARALREALHAVYVAHTLGRPAPAEALGLVNQEVGRALGRLRLRPHESHYDWGWDWGWEDGAEALDRPLWPIARAAADLLTAGDLERVRTCAADTCGWIFVDRTRNHSRRWCDMKDCGNVAKVRRFRTRHKEADAEAPA